MDDEKTNRWKKLRNKELNNTIWEFKDSSFLLPECINKKKTDERKKSRLLSCFELSNKIGKQRGRKLWGHRNSVQFQTLNTFNSFIKKEEESSYEDKDLEEDDDFFYPNTKINLRSRKDNKVKKTNTYHSFKFNSESPEKGVNFSTKFCSKRSSATNDTSFTMRMGRVLNHSLAPKKSRNFQHQDFSMVTELMNKSKLVDKFSLNKQKRLKMSLKSTKRSPKIINPDLKAIIRQNILPSNSNNHEFQKSSLNKKSPQALKEVLNKTNKNPLNLSHQKRRLKYKPYTVISRILKDSKMIINRSKISDFPLSKN